MIALHILPHIRQLRQQVHAHFLHKFIKLTVDENTTHAVIVQCQDVVTFNGKVADRRYKLLPAVLGK